VKLNNDQIDTIMMWIVRLLSIAAMSLLMFGCSAQWHVQRAVLKDPSILEYREVRLDTVVVTEPQIVKSIEYLTNYDTIENVVDDIRYKIIRQVDSFEIEIECPPDTVKIEVIKNVPQVKYIPLTWWEKNRWWIFLLLGLSVSAFVLTRRFKL